MREHKQIKWREQVAFHGNDVRRFSYFAGEVISGQKTGTVQQYLKHRKARYRYADLPVVTKLGSLRERVLLCIAKSQFCRENVDNLNP